MRWRPVLSLKTESMHQYHCYRFLITTLILTILYTSKIRRLSDIESQGIDVYVISNNNEKPSWVRSDQLESYFSKLMHHSYQNIGEYKVIYGNGKHLNTVVEIIEERGDIDDLVIHHSDKTNDCRVMATFAQIEKGCFFVFYKQFENLMDSAINYYHNFVVFQKLFPETLSYLRMNLLEVKCSPN